MFHVNGLGIQPPVMTITAMKKGCKCSSTCPTVPREGDCVGRGRRNIRTQLKGQPGSLNPGSSPSEEVTTFFTS